MKTKEYIVRSSDEGTLLIVWLSQVLKISKNKAKQLLDDRHVFVNNQRVWMARHVLAKGDKLSVLIDDEPAVQLKRSHIVYEDEAFIAVNKPSGMITNNDPKSVEERLRVLCHDPHICAVHRLDKETSGVTLFAKTSDLVELMKPIFSKQEIAKTYTALIYHKPKKLMSTISTPIEKKEAHTKVQVLRTNERASLVEISIATGRKHQIRIHLHSIGCPILGDKTYHTALAHSLYKQIPRQMLHASRISFVHPLTHKPVVATAPLPQDFVESMKLLGLG